MTILYSSKTEVIHHWQSAFEMHGIQICHHEKELFHLIEGCNEYKILFLDATQYENEAIEGFLDLLQKDYPDVKTIVLSSKPNYSEGSSLLKFGIKAYANTYMAQTHLQDALNAVKAGNVWLYPEFIQMMIGELSQLHKKPFEAQSKLLCKLSEREKQIALLVKKGLSNKEIAFKTEITERTVKAHISAIFEKIGVRDRLSLALVI